MHTQFYEELLEALKRGVPVCVVTVVETTGSTPRKAGAKMLVFHDGRTVGTIGGSLVETSMIEKAKVALKTGEPRIEKFRLHREDRQTSGMICGGEMTLFIEPLVGNRHLYIFGAGHCGYALARVASIAGFVIHILDDRLEVASRERFPMAATTTVGNYQKISAEITLIQDAFVTIMTHAHAADADVLANVIKKQYVYLGLMASERKKTQIFKHLRAKGISQEFLNTVHSPIGLDIDAETPEEIAVSIGAELVQVARDKQRNVKT